MYLAARHDIRESIQNLSFSDFAFGGNSPLPQNLFSPCKIPLCIYKNCKHLQVLVQFGESRKIVEVVNGKDLASVLHKVKTLFYNNMMMTGKHG